MYWQKFGWTLAPSTAAKAQLQSGQDQQRQGIKS